MTQETLVLRQSSMQGTDKDEQKRTDLIESMTYRVDAVGYTELDALMKRILKKRAADMGGHLFLMGSVGIYLNPRHTPIEHGGVKVLPGQSVGKGSYKERGVLFVTFQTPGGNVVTVHEAHWITDAANNPRRDAKRLQQSEAMVDLVTLHGRGRRLSFWMGDTNSDEREGNRDEVQKTLTRGHCVSIYDALKKYPATKGKKTIDVIGHYDADGRVTPKRVVAGKVRNADHKQVTATYVIDERVKRTPGTVHPPRHPQDRPVG